MPINAELLSILACPLTKKPVVQDGEWIVSTDPETRKRYPIREDIPVMLIEESEELSPEAWNDIMQRHSAGS